VYCGVGCLNVVVLIFDDGPGFLMGVLFVMLRVVGVYVIFFFVGN